MMPAKIIINENFKPPRPHLAAPELRSSTQWANSVQSIIPFLDKDGVHQALRILDVATNLAQQAHALKEIVTLSQGQTDTTTSCYQSTAESMLAHVVWQQQTLLAELHQLRYPSAKAFPLGATNTGQDVANVGQDIQTMPYAGLDAPIIREAFPSDDALQGCVQPRANEVRQADASPATGAERFRPGAPRQIQTLSTSLQMLSEEDPACLLIVRRINRMGFKATRILKKHFSQHGPVVRVLLAHSTVRQNADLQGYSRRRPSSLGFVQMALASSVTTILGLGAEQEVDGVVIRVQKFERQNNEELEETLDSADLDQMPRQPTCGSTTSATSVGTTGSSECPSRHTESGSGSNSDEM